MKTTWKGWYLFNQLFFCAYYLEIIIDWLIFAKRVQRSGVPFPQVLPEIAPYWMIVPEQRWLTVRQHLSVLHHFTAWVNPWNHDLRQDAEYFIITNAALILFRITPVPLPSPHQTSLASGHLFSSLWFGHFKNVISWNDIVGDILRLPFCPPTHHNALTSIHCSAYLWFIPFYWRMISRSMGMPQLVYLCIYSRMFPRIFGLGPITDQGALKSCAQTFVWTFIFISMG